MAPRRPSLGKKPTQAPGKTKAKKTKVEAEGPGKTVRIIENGFDLTPLPLLADVGDQDALADVVAAAAAPAPAADADEESSTGSSESGSESGSFSESYSESESDDEGPAEDKFVTIRLEESKTETLLHIRGRCVAVGSPRGIKDLRRGRRLDSPSSARGAAAAATWIVRGFLNNMLWRNSGPDRPSGRSPQAPGRRPRSSTSSPPR